MNVVAKQVSLYDFFERINKPAPKFTGKKLKPVVFMTKEESPSGKTIYAYYYKHQYIFRLEDLANYVNKTYKTVKKAFDRAIVKNNSLLEHTHLIEDIDYLYLDKQGIVLHYKMSSKSNRGKTVNIAVFERGFPLMLSSMSGEHTYALLYKYNEAIFNERLKRKQLGYKPKSIFELPIPKGKHVTNRGDLVNSRGEGIIADMLLDFGIMYQVDMPYYYNRTRITPDFWLLSEPTTVIEYWGRENDNAYNKSRIFKERIYKELGWRLINIEHDEVNNKPKLRLKLKKLLCDQ